MRFHPPHFLFLRLLFHFMHSPNIFIIIFAHGMDCSFFALHIRFVDRISSHLFIDLILFSSVSSQFLIQSMIAFSFLSLPHHCSKSLSTHLKQDFRQKCIAIVLLYDFSIFFNNKKRPRNHNLNAFKFC